MLFLVYLYNVLSIKKSRTLIIQKSVFQNINYRYLFGFYVHISMLILKKYAIKEFAIIELSNKNLFQSLNYESLDMNYICK